jgi:hypothetical protein
MSKLLEQIQGKDYAKSIVANNKPVELKIIYFTLINLIWGSTSMDYSVGIYKNLNDNTIFLIPNGFDQHGIRTNINKPAVLKEPYAPATIGRKLRECFEVTVNRQYTDEDLKAIVTRLVTGEKSDKKIVKEHLFQWVFFNREMGYEFEAKMNSKDGRGYTAIPDSPPLAVDSGAEDRELGNAVMQTFEACK